MTAIRISALALAAAAVAVPAHAAEGDRAQARLEGEGISGTVDFVETASGIVHVTVSAQGVAEGIHGFHVHETGKCDAGDGYKSAGGHLAGGREHGIDSADGPHPGDLPNVHVGADGVIAAEYFARGFTLGGEGEVPLFDADGAAVILHSGKDDYSSQPSGDAGSRIACGVVEKK